MKVRLFLSQLTILLSIVLAAAVGCNQAPKVKPDAQINSEIQSKFNQDSGLAGRQLNVQTSNGVVTIDGAVENQTQRDAAARLAASVDGVKTVVNNIQVATPPLAETAAAEPAPEPAPVKHRPPARRHETTRSTEQASPAPSNHVAAAPSTMEAMNTTPPPPPAPKKVTIPEGTTLAVRLVDAINSETSQQGQTFHATLDSPLAVEGDTAIPAGYDVQGHIVDVKSAGKFAGQSLLVLQLDRIAVGSKYYNIQTDQYKRQGTSRTKNTAEKVGAGAAIGAIIGGLAGGGKGAAIGAAAGGGLGGGVQAATKGQQIKLPSETVLNFTLQSALTVTPTTEGPNAGRQKLPE